MNLKAKATMIRRHLPAWQRPAALFLLRMWPWTRMVSGALPPRLTGRARPRRRRRALGHGLGGARRLARRLSAGAERRRLSLQPPPALLERLFRRGPLALDERPQLEAPGRSGSSRGRRSAASRASAACEVAVERVERAGQVGPLAQPRHARAREEEERVGADADTCRARGGPGRHRRSSGSTPSAAGARSGSRGRPSSAPASSPCQRALWQSIAVPAHVAFEAADRLEAGPAVELDHADRDSRRRELVSAGRRPVTVVGFAASRCRGAGRRPCARA